MVRVFIGSLLSEIKDDLIKIQKEIEKLPLKAKFVEPSNFHLTFSFLGEKNEFEIEKIKERLSEICKNKKSFKVEIRDLIPIPNEKYIRVIAFEVESNELKILQKEIKESIGGDVKPPHLTLCRVKRVDDKEKVVKYLKEIKFNKAIEIKSIQIIKSKLTPKGPIYSALYSVNLL